MKQEISKYLAFPMELFTLYDVEDNEIDEIEIDAVKDGYNHINHDGYNHINDIINALGLITINLTKRNGLCSK